VGTGDSLGAVVKRKIPSPCRESNPRFIQPVGSVNIHKLSTSINCFTDDVWLIVVSLTTPSQFHNYTASNGRMMVKDELGKMLQKGTGVCFKALSHTFWKGKPHKAEHLDFGLSVEPMISRIQKDIQ